MSSLPHLLIIGLASNLDNLAVGVAYGLRQIVIPPQSNFTIVIIAFVFSTLAVLGGTCAGRFVTH